MESPVVALRSKALRALGSIVTVDPDVLAMVSAHANRLLIKLISAICKIGIGGSTCGRLACRS